MGLTHAVLAMQGCDLAETGKKFLPSISLLCIQVQIYHLVKDFWLIVLRHSA